MPLDKMAPVTLCLLSTILDRKHAKNIGCIGEEIISITEFTVITERLPITTVTDFRKAVIALQYSKEVGNTLLFIERYLLGITTGPRMTAPAAQAISAIGKMTI